MVTRERSDKARALLAARKERKAARVAAGDITSEWFSEEARYFDDQGQLAAAVCGRRAGKTRGGCRDFIRDARATPGARLLYLNSTRGEAERLAWYGNRNDGMAALVTQYKIPAKLDNAALTIHFPHNDAWIYLRGADDEAELRKALGGAYHKVWWDEAQKIPPKLNLPIREVFMPALLDFGGKFRMTGTPVRQMTGLFFEVTRPELSKRRKGWNVHHWNLLHNPFFGRAVQRRDGWHVIALVNKHVSGPHGKGELAAAVLGARWTHGMLALQQLYGGPEVAPIDSPIMQREGFGLWTREDAAYVYHVNKVRRDSLLYAPARLRPDGFPDIKRALRDLPWRWEEGFFSLGADIGYYPDPFAFVLWGWHPYDRRLYEIASWRKNYLTSDQQNAALQSVREHVAIAITVADAGGPARSAVAGWSAQWKERYGLDILEAEKAHKHIAIDTMNGDITSGGIALREDGVLFEEMSNLQWATIVSATGRMIEDPTMDNHACDGALYAHRHSYQFRVRPDDKVPDVGTPDRALYEERAMEDALEDGQDDGY